MRFTDTPGDLSLFNALLAGDPVLIAPVSSEIPCKQGILQGISRYLDVFSRSCAVESVESAVAPAFFGHFPARINREIISSSRDSNWT
jgi:hypothetical protein